MGWHKGLKLSWNLQWHGQPLESLYHQNESNQIYCLNFKLNGNSYNNQWRLTSSTSKITLQSKFLPTHTVSNQNKVFKTNRNYYTLFAFIKINVTVYLQFTASRKLHIKLSSKGNRPLDWKQFCYSIPNPIHFLDYLSSSLLLSRKQGGTEREERRERNRERERDWPNAIR